MRKIYFNWAIFISLFLTTHLALAATSQQSTLLQPLIEAQELSAALEANLSIQLLDIRSPEDYQQGHLPGAISAPYGKWRGPAHNPGQLATTEHFEQLVRSLGLTAKQPVVVYSTGADTTDFGAAARVYWTLKYLGFNNLSLLNGGFLHWQQALQPVTTTPNQPTPSNFKVNLQADLAILKDELLGKIEESNNHLPTNQQPSSYQLLDARPPAFFQGQQKAPTATLGGTIATATNSPFQQWFNSYDNRLRPVTEIQALIQEQGLDAASETISFCNTGHWAATNWFVFSEIAQLPSVRLYPGSMADWTQDQAALPMQNTPSRWQQIKNQFQKMWN